MTTICITLPALKTITLGLSSDWGPTLHAAARRLGAVVALIYTLGFMAGERWHQLVAPALPPARSVNVTPPRPGIIHISDPMVRALRMVHEGKSQRLAAHLCGVSRTSLQRALKA